MQTLYFVANLLLSLVRISYFQPYLLSVDVQLGMLAGRANVSFKKTSGIPPRRAKIQRTLGVSRSSLDSLRQRHAHESSARTQAEQRR